MCVRVRTQSVSWLRTVPSAVSWTGLCCADGLPGLDASVDSRARRQVCSRLVSARDDSSVWSPQPATVVLESRSRGPLVSLAGVSDAARAASRVYRARAHGAVQAALGCAARRSRCLSPSPRDREMQRPGLTQHGERRQRQSRRLRRCMSGRSARRGCWSPGAGAIEPARAPTPQREALS